MTKEGNRLRRGHLSAGGYGVPSLFGTWENRGDGILPRLKTRRLEAASTLPSTKMLSVISRNPRRRLCRFRGPLCESVLPRKFPRRNLLGRKSPRLRVRAPALG